MVFSSPADSLRLEGEPFRPNARIVWAATNEIPPRLMIYQVVPQQFSNELISNLLKITFFKPVNMKLSADKKTMSWRYREEDGGLVRSLDVAPSFGYINYFNTDAKKEDTKHPATGVPSYEEVEKLAVHYLQLLGGDTNQLSWKPQSRTELDSTSYDKRPWKGGHVIQQQVLMRGIMLCRQVDNIRFNSPCGRGGIFITIGSNARISDLELNWRNLQTFHLYKTVTQAKIVKFIKTGNAVVPDPENTDLTSLLQAKKLTITDIAPRYWGEVGGAPQDFVYPFAELQVTADLGGTNKINFVLNCPVIDETQPLSPAEKNNSP